MQSYLLVNDSINTVLIKTSLNPTPVKPWMIGNLNKLLTVLKTFNVGRILVD